MLSVQKARVLEHLLVRVLLVPRRYVIQIATYELQYHNIKYVLGTMKYCLQDRVSCLEYSLALLQRSLLLGNIRSPRVCECKDSLLTSDRNFGKLNPSPASYPFASIVIGKVNVGLDSTSDTSNRNSVVLLDRRFSLVNRSKAF